MTSYLKQTQDDFERMVEETTAQYQKQFDDYGWKYKFNFENLGDIQAFFISSGDFCSTIKFNSSIKHITKTNLTDVDIKRFLKLKEGL